MTQLLWLPGNGFLVVCRLALADDSPIRHGEGNEVGTDNSALRRDGNSACKGNIGIVGDDGL
jgi:hypothetical protein